MTRSTLALLLAAGAIVAGVLYATVGAAIVSGVS